MDHEIHIGGGVGWVMVAETLRGFSFGRHEALRLFHFDLLFWDELKINLKYLRVVCAKP